MKPICRFILSVAVTGAVSLTTAFGARADFDNKFTREAAQRVWSMDMPDFDPAVSLTDTVYTNASAAIIARYYGVDAALNTYDTDYAKYRNTGREATNRIDAVTIDRRMVKLNDTKAVDEYSTFEIDAKDDVTMNSYTMMKYKVAFGARVYKSDGSVRDVDVAGALTLTEGKYDSEKSYRVAVEGLEPGDIIDYFYLNELYLDEFSMPVKSIPIVSKYPTLHFTVDYKVDPRLTVEYRNYNGAPEFRTFRTEGEKNHFGVRLENVGAIESTPPFFSSARQLPFLRVAVMNNYKSLFEYHPQSARIGGVQNINEAMLTTDIGHAIVDVRLGERSQNDAKKYLGRWRKANPDATEQQIADAAYLSTFYAMATTVGDFSDRQMMVEMANIMKHAGIKENVSVGVSATREDVPVSDALTFSDPDYYLHFGDRYYFLGSRFALAPGEAAGIYGGEQAFEYPSPVQSKAIAFSSTGKNLPQSRAKDNQIHQTVNVEFLPDDSLKVTVDLRATGVSKSQVSIMADISQQLTEIEKYLGIDHDKNKPFVRDTVAYKKMRQDAAAILAGSMFNSDVKAENLTYSIGNIGVCPDNTELQMSLDATVGGLVSEAGNRKVLNIGHFLGEQTKVEGKHRQRDIDVVMAVPSTERYDIGIAIPEGYTVEPSALEALGRNVSTTAGSLFASAEPADDNNIRLSVRIRYPKAVYSVEEWPELLKVLDAVSDYVSVVLPIVPKK